MIRKHLKPFLILLISCSFFAAFKLFACWGGDWDPTEGSSFTPEIINQPTLSPFFRTIGTPFYNGYDDAGKNYFKRLNCSEWVGYFQNKTDTSTIYYWLYEAKLNQIDSMIFYIKGKSANLSDDSQKFKLKQIEAAKSIPFLYFVGYAKRNETFAVKDEENYWDPKPTKKAATVFIEKQIEGGLNFYNKATDSFIKERFAFQLLRLYYFNNDFNKTITFFNENERILKISPAIKNRCLGYKAAALYKLQKFSESNIAYARLFEYEPLKRSAYLSYHPLSDAEMQQCLLEAKLTVEKENLWLLQGLYTDKILAIQQLLKLNSKSSAALLLLMRTVNIEEEKFRNILLATSKETTKAEARVDKKLINFLNEISANGKNGETVIWDLSAAYLNYIIKNYALADEQMKKAKPFTKGNSLLQAQYSAIALTGKLRRLIKLDDAAEKDLLPELNILFSEEIIKSDIFRGTILRGEVRKILSSIYRKQNELQKAELILPQEFKTQDELTKMIFYLNRTNFTDFEALFIKNGLLKKDDYVLLSGVRYAQHDELEKAIEILKGKESYNTLLLGNPFTIHIKDCHDCDHQANQRIKYTRGTFLQKLLEMETIAQRKPLEAAQNYFLVANGFYNMTEFGNARVFYQTYVYNFIYDDGRKLLPEQTSDIALKYYLLAMQNTTDKEFRAKCAFMVAKCEQNAWFMRTADNYKGDFKAGMYFGKLKNEYNNTKYYQEIINECGYFKTYLNY